ncbi:10291_t:CDS:2, partial [Scutellospora calospora]
YKDCSGFEKDKPTETGEAENLDNIINGYSLIAERNFKLYHLGIYYLPEDRQMAIKYLNLAASQNNNDAK